MCHERWAPFYLLAQRTSQTGRRVPGQCLLVTMPEVDGTFHVLDSVTSFVGLDRMQYKKQF